MKKQTACKGGRVKMSNHMKEMFMGDFRFYADREGITEGYKLARIIYGKQSPSYKKARKALYLSQSELENTIKKWR